MVSKIFAALLLASQASAHFLLNWPTSIGFDDDNEGNGPCGGFTPDFSKANISDFHVGGDTIFLKGTHPTTTFLIRGTLDQTANGNYTNFLQPYQVVGLGNNCNPLVPGPSSFAGSKGIIQIVADSPDGILYQCAAVNFVSGSGPAKGSNGCANATGVTISYTADANFNFLGNSTSAGNSTSSTPSSSSGAASATKSGAAAGTLTPMSYGGLGSMSWMVLVAGATFAIRLL